MNDETVTQVAMPRWMVYHLAVVWLTLALIVGAGVWYVQEVVAHEDRTVRQVIVDEARVQCGIYVLLDGAYQQAPPTTATGKKFAQAIHQVVTKLGCP